MRKKYQSHVGHNEWNKVVLGARHGSPLCEAERAQRAGVIVHDELYKMIKVSET